jgi:trehalose 6-phosphate phosphatase
VTVTLSRISDLPHALRDGQQFARRLDGRQPAVFLDYDGTLTPIVDRPEDAVISDSMRDAVRGLTERATVCVVSGRDRPLITRWMGIDSLVVAGSHGFDIGDHRTGTIRHDAAVGFESLLSTVTDRLRSDVTPVCGAVVEPKRFSVAVHYRLVVGPQRPFVKAVVDTLLADYPDQFVSLYLGDDITDEDAFRALKGSYRPGIGVVVADPDEPEQARRTTAADFVLWSMGEVQQFLNTLAR